MTTAPPLHTFGPPPPGEAHLTAGMPGPSWQLRGQGLGLDGRQCESHREGRRRAGRRTRHTTGREAMGHREPAAVLCRAASAFERKGQRRAHSRRGEASGMRRHHRQPARMAAPAQRGAQAGGRPTSRCPGCTAGRCSCRASARRRRLRWGRQCQTWRPAGLGVGRSKSAAGSQTAYSRGMTRRAATSSAGKLPEPKGSGPARWQLGRCRAASLHRRRCNRSTGRTLSEGQAQAGCSPGDASAHP